MSDIASPTPLLAQLRSSHALMMECAATAERLLGYDRPAGSPPTHQRAQEEAARMAGLFARLGEYFGRGAVLESILTNAAPVSPANPPAVAPAPSASAAKLHAAPGAPRGRLKNGNPSGDYLKSPRCGAHTRAGGCCRQPAMANGRCRMHGGLSTGPRTPTGLARCRTTRLVHACRIRAHRALRTRAVHAARRLRALTSELSARVSAGHGVHRSVSIVARRRAAWLAARRRERAAANTIPGSPISAGHGVHRSNSVNRRDAEAQRDRVSHSRSRSPSSSASLRLRGESLERNGPLSAGHGLHRSFRDHLCSSAFICGFNSIPTTPMRNFVLPSAAVPR